MPNNPALVHFRLAAAGDIARLNEIALRSKAYWGYGVTQIEAWRPQLAIAPAWVAMQRVKVALIDDAIVGFFVILGEPGQWRLEHLWVEPVAIGKGVGRALLDQACQLAHRLGAGELLIEADPSAEGFYLACGAQRVGAIAAPIENEPSRTLPVLRLLRRA